MYTFKHTDFFVVVIESDHINETPSGVAVVLAKSKVLLKLLFIYLFILEHCGHSPHSKCTQNIIYLFMFCSFRQFYKY